jgi:hypothetical protein
LEPTIDPYRVAESWLELIAPALAEYRETNHKARFILLKHVKPTLIDHQMPYDDVAAAFIDLPAAAPLDERVTACIIGVSTNS